MKMTINNTVKNNNDTEKAYDSMINSSEFISNIRNKMSFKSNIIAKTKTLETESIDSFIDKKNRMSN